MVPLVQQVYRVNQGYQDMMVYRDVLAKLGLKETQDSQEILELQDPMGCLGKKVIVVPVCLQWAWEWVRMRIVNSKYALNSNLPPKLKWPFLKH